MMKMTLRAVTCCGLILGGLLGGCISSPPPATGPATATTKPPTTLAAAMPATTQAAGALRWTLEKVESVGGMKPTVLGAPKVANDDSGKAIEFNGKSDGLILPVVPLAGMKAFTLEVLFEPESGGPAEQRFIHSEDDAGNRMTMETRLTPDGKWSLDTFLLSGANHLAILDQTKLHPADQWYWVALRYDGKEMVSFIDGVQEGKGAVAFPPMGEKGRVSLGVRLNQVSWFKGMIREVRVTDRALAEGELQKGK